MAYLALYIVCIAFIFRGSRVGWLNAVQRMLSILLPSLLIILFTVRAGHLIFRSPLVGLISILLTTFLIYHGSKPLVNAINSWLESKTNGCVDLKDVVEVEVVSKEDV